MDCPDHHWPYVFAGLTSWVQAVAMTALSFTCLGLAACVALLFKRNGM